MWYIEAGRTTFVLESYVTTVTVEMTQDSSCRREAVERERKRAFKENKDWSEGGRGERKLIALSEKSPPNGI